MLRSLTSSIINVVKCHNPNSIRIEQKLFRPVIYPIFFILFFFIINQYIHTIENNIIFVGRMKLLRLNRLIYIE